MIQQPEKQDDVMASEVSSVQCEHVLFDERQTRLGDAEMISDKPRSAYVHAAYVDTTDGPCAPVE